MSSTAYAVKRKSFALVDCNNFYASCERLFRPDLKNTPVVVLSNNDGCIIARSKEAKALGFKMGEPAFKAAQRLAHHQVSVFSSNYALYADMSNRVMTLLETLAPNVEIYSIDEAFLDLSGVPNLNQFGLDTQAHINKCTGIQVCVGIGPTKTLAKLANHAAKAWPATGGVVDLSARERQRKLMALLPVNEVWGIGRKLSQRLRNMGISTALQLADSNFKTMRRSFSVVLQRTICELNGESCLELELMPPSKQQVVVSRSFAERVTDLQTMRKAIASYTVRAAEKLRAERRSARGLQVFIRTSSFASKEPCYSNSASLQIPLPTGDTRDLLEHSRRLLVQIWRPGFRYAKAGVTLSDFYEPGVFQPDLFNDNKPRHASAALMQVIDHINQHTSGRVHFAGQGIKPRWGTHNAALSPCYTTRWQDLPTVR